MKRIILISVVLSLALFPIYAQDGSFFGDDLGGEGGGSSLFQLGGTLLSEVTVNASKNGLEDLFDRKAGADLLTESTSLRLNGLFSGSKSEFLMDLDFTISDVSVKELYARYFGDYATITAGYAQVVWGKADEYHVVDVLNSLDLSDFLQTNYLSMVIPRPMLKADIPLWGDNLIEAVWIPSFEGNNIPMEGQWAPQEMGKAKEIIGGAVSYNAASIYAATFAAQMIATGNNEPLSNAAASMAQSAYLSANQHGESFYTPTNSLDYSQLGLRLTGSAKGLDYGFVYYLGYNKMPSLTFTGYPVITDARISFDPLQVFGIEGAVVLAGFNLKGEFAYNMTEDLAGDDPAIHNNSLKWVGGFDRNLSLSNLNINIQEAGTVLLKSDKISNASDIETAAAYTENVITVSLSDNYNHEKVELRLTGMYHFEGKDWSVIPEAVIELDDNLEASISGRFYQGDNDTLFGQFDENDELTMEIAFRI